MVFGVRGKTHHRLCPGDFVVVATALLFKDSCEVIARLFAEIEMSPHDGARQAHVVDDGTTMKFSKHGSCRNACLFMGDPSFASDLIGGWIVGIHGGA